MRNIVNLSRMMYNHAKTQFYAGDISQEEYLETLKMIYKNLNIIENDDKKNEFVIKSLLDMRKISVKNTIQLALSLN